MEDRLSALIYGFMPAQLVYVMARLGIADVLGDEQMTVAEISSVAGGQPDMMRRLLRGLAGFGLVELEPDDRVSLTEMGGLLASAQHGSMRSVALHVGGTMSRAWAELEHGIRTGRAPFHAAHGESFFDHLRNHPAAGAAFDEMMTQASRRVISEAVSAWNFQSASHVLDVGGGRGHFVAAVLNAHTDLQGAVFDMTEACPGARKLIGEKGLANRCEVIGGSFFEVVPPGYDVHLLKWILHDWNDASCHRILKTCRAALPETGRLLVIERLLPDAIAANGSLHPVVAMDLIMLVNFADARERTIAEYDQLLTTSGFAIHRIIELPSSGFSILDCTPHG